MPLLQDNYTYKEYLNRLLHFNHEGIAQPVSRFDSKYEYPGGPGYSAVAMSGPRHHTAYNVIQVCCLVKGDDEGFRKLAVSLFIVNCQLSIFTRLHPAVSNGRVVGG